jgi:hypothetical protein
MKSVSSVVLAAAALSALTVCVLSHSPAPASPSGSGVVHGTVRDVNGPVAGAVVRVQATGNRTQSAADGTFVLVGLPVDAAAVVTAWAPGCYVGWIEAVADSNPVVIDLKRHYTTDNPAYQWFSHEAVEGSKSCGKCMPGTYDQWEADAHSQSAVNPRFLTMYNGTDVSGNQSPATRYAHSPDYGRFPLRPDPAKPYYGPGYKLDFPNTAGNCATCHLPAAAAHPGKEYAVNPNEVTGVEAEGVFCEFCHKIGDVTLNAATGSPPPNMPGVLSMRLYRPNEDEQLFFGTVDDVTRRVSYLQLEKESTFCAPCHFGVFWDTVVYNSFGEWLASPYSDPNTGQTCQACHMPATDATRFTRAEEGGLERPPGHVHDHRMPGALDEQFLQNAVTLTASADADENRLVVTVSITNDKTGHHVPTDSPLRHLLLLVSATDAQGNVLPLVEGPTIPAWGGVGDPREGYYAGRSGKGFALVLEELWTRLSPTGAYWNPTRVLSDNRLAAFATDTSTYVFAAPPGGTGMVEVTLLFRRAFIELMDRKGWDIPDIVMARQSIQFP